MRGNSMYVLQHREMNYHHIGLTSSMNSDTELVLQTSKKGEGKKIKQFFFFFFRFVRQLRRLQVSLLL